MKQLKSNVSERANGSPQAGSPRLALGAVVAAVLVALATGFTGIHAESGPSDTRGIGVEIVSAKALKEFRKAKADNLRLVNFWATWCGSCVEEFPELIELSRRYGDSGLQLVTVSANQADEQAGVEKFLARYQPQSRNFLMGDSDTYMMMKTFDDKWTETLPYTVLVDRKGKIVYRHEGRINLIELEETIRREIDR